MTKKQTNEQWSKASCVMPVRERVLVFSFCAWGNGHREVKQMSRAYAAGKRLSRDSQTGRQSLKPCKPDQEADDAGGSEVQGQPVKYSEPQSKSKR